ncbi:hypothetical protein IH779_02685 [Patescibacteria group bacterium]|nr:hypothetical protein [Patescibacteria group bacterium]
MAKRKFRQGSRLIPGTGGMRYSHHKMDKILDERFSWDIHKGFISRDGAIRSLKKLRREEFNAATGEKRRELKRERLVLEEGFGLKGKY